MKKLIVLLLTIAMVGAVSAQVKTAVSLSGSVYLENVGVTTPSGDPTSSLSPNGAGYDVLTFTASGKDDKYGVEFYDNDLFKTPGLVVDYWDAWYDIGIAKVTFGNLNGGSYVQYFSNGWIENYDPTDNIAGNGVLVESDKLVQNLSIGIFMPLTGAKSIDTVKKLSVGASYSMPNVATLKSQLNLDMDGKATNVNVGFQYIGLKNLDLYGWGKFQQATANYVEFGVGSQYKTSLYRVGAEVEGTTGDAAGFAWDVVANARYYVTPTFFVQIRPDYQVYSDLSTTVNYPDGKFRIRGYANYAFGNGFSVEGMIGYDTSASSTFTTGSKYDATKHKPVNEFIHYIKLGYSMSF